MSDLASGVSVGCNPFGGKSSSLTYPPMSILVARFLAVKGQHDGLLGVIYGWFAPLFPPSSLPFRLNLVCDLVFMPLLAGTLLAMVAAPPTGLQRGGASPTAT